MPSAERKKRAAEKAAANVDTQHHVVSEVQQPATTIDQPTAEQPASEAPRQPRKRREPIERASKKTALAFISQYRGTMESLRAVASKMPEHTRRANAEIAIAEYLSETDDDMPLLEKMRALIEEMPVVSKGREKKGRGNNGVVVGLRGKAGVAVASIRCEGLASRGERLSTTIVADAEALGFLVSSTTLSFPLMIVTKM